MAAAAGTTNTDAAVLSDEFNERVKFFADYLDADSAPHKQRLASMMQKGARRFVADLNDLRDYDRAMWQNLVLAPMDYIPAFEKAVVDVVKGISPVELDQQERFHVGFDGAVPQFELNPRTLAANYLGRLVVLEGIVTRCSLVRPKVRRSVHYCEVTKLFHARDYRDATMAGNDIPTTSMYPTTDADNHPLTTEFGLCSYEDFQTITIQEMPERSPPGLLPRSVDVVLNADLVDKVKPGDRVRLYGVYRSMGGTLTGAVRSLIIANNLFPLMNEVFTRAASENEIDMIKKFGKRRNIVDLLGNSLAPSIYGHENIKKAILLLLLGGTEKNLVNGTHIRGDINILMVGDPSTAKSQLLRFVLKMAPLAVATTGRGSSGVGLTAAVVTDRDSGERRLEAGAMVLADRGVVCIDEFDKMSDVDRVAIHEVMEQQTVTIAKAGIHTSLNARCSVVAAANPIYGQYDNSLSPAENAGLPDSLMSRFDLVFTVLDEINPTTDRVLSSHVVKMHRYIPPDLEEGEPIVEAFNTLSIMDVNGTQEDDDSPYEKHHPLLSIQHIRGQSKPPQILKNSFLKKYIHYAKNRVKPQLSTEASDYIVERYVEFREKAKTIADSAGSARKAKIFPVTARTLEAMIRLATAHAKARLSNRVEKKDAQAAADLVNYSIFREIESLQKREMDRKAKKARTDDHDETGDSDDHIDSDENVDYDALDEGVITAKSSGGRSTRRIKTGKVDSSVSQSHHSKVADDTASMAPSQVTSSSGGVSHLIESSASSTSQRQPLKLTSERFREFQSGLHAVRNSLGASATHVGKTQLLEALNTSQTRFSAAELEAGLIEMSEQNQLMIVDEDVYFI